MSDPPPPRLSEGPSHRPQPVLLIPRMLAGVAAGSREDSRPPRLGLAVGLVPPPLVRLEPW